MSLPFDLFCVCVCVCATALLLVFFCFVFVSFRSLSPSHVNVLIIIINYIGRIYCVVMALRLCDAVANLCRFLSNTLVDWTQIWALLSNRSIALDKSPGIRMIGVGETLRWIIGKSVSLVIKDDAESVCGSKQLCAGLKCGIEGVIHTDN